MIKTVLDYLLFRKLIGDLSLQWFVIIVVVIFTLDFFSALLFGFSFFAEGGSGGLELKMFFFVGSVLIYRIYIEKMMVSFKTFRVFNSWALGFLAQNDIRSRFVEKDKEAIGSLFKGVKSFFNFDSFCFVWVVSVFFIAVILSALFVGFDYHFFDAFKIKPGYVYFLSVFSNTAKSSFGFKVLFDILSVLYLRVYLEIAVISLRKLQLSEIVLENMQSGS